MLTVRQLLDYIKNNNISLDAKIPNITEDSLSHVVHTSNTFEPLFEIDGFKSKVTFVNPNNEPVLKLETYNFTEFVLNQCPMTSESTEDELEKWKENIRNSVEFPPDMDKLQKRWFEKTINQAVIEAAEYHCFTTTFKDLRVYAYK